MFLARPLQLFTGTWRAETEDWFMPNHSRFGTLERQGHHSAGNNVMTSIKQTILATVCALASLSAVSDAKAGPTTPTISIAISQNAAQPNSAVLSTTSGLLSYNGFTSSFSSVSITAFGSPLLPQPSLQTSSIDVKSTTAGDKNLYIYITEQGLSDPVGQNRFLSSFTANSFLGAVTSVEEYTFIDTSNGLWGGTALASQAFTAIGSATSNNLTPSLGAYYSETAKFVIHMAGSGSVNNTINIQKVPEPVSAALLGIGMIGTGVTARRRRQSAMR
jgi:hypothetical protein